MSKDMPEEPIRKKLPDAPKTQGTILDMPEEPDHQINDFMVIRRELISLKLHQEVFNDISTEQ